ncbi:MAG: alanine--tRNA ligase-related protein, partial [Microcoleaceae cyanobacterium]
ETDLIFPIVATAAKLANIDYDQSDEKTKVSLKVIGDHVRSVMHMIADGITASNIGRGYILRRLIRRVVRHGRLIGINGEFTTDVLETAIALAEKVYPNVRERETVIKSELQREESRFLETLERGEKLLAETMEKAEKTKVISGQDAFILYDTFGFPLELTQEIAEEKGFTVDVPAFDKEMELQRQRSQSAHETIDLTVQGSIDQLAQNIQATDFIGYELLTATATIEGVLVNGKPVEQAKAGEQVQILLDQTPFYAESGGQVADQGYLTSGEGIIKIHDVKKESNIFVHFGQVERGSFSLGMTVNAQIDRTYRRRTQANHTATHLLQAALKLIVDPNISQ